MELEKISPEKLLEAAKAIVAATDAALEELKAYQATHRINSKAELARNAYLHGVLHGLGKAKREFEMRCPIEFTES
jgi:predicted transcriptional regulator of viral defense system